MFPPSGTRSSAGGCTGWGMGRVGTGWVYRVGNTGVPTQPAARARKSHTQRSGPRKPCQGAGVGGVWGWVRVLGDGGGTAPGTTWALPRPAPSGRCPRTLRMPPYSQYGEIPLHLLKVSQNRQVSPKSVKRPVIVPISKKGPRSHLLKFSDFRFTEPSLTRN